MALCLPQSMNVGLCLLVGALALACGDKGDDDGDDTTSSGGKSGAGAPGTAGNAGSSTGGTGGTSQVGPAEVIYGFDSSDEGFKFEIYENEMYQNLGESSTLSWDGTTEGQDGKAGVLKVEVPFSEYNQLADIQVNFSETDWSTKTLRAWVKLESGLSPDDSSPGGAYIFVKTGSDYKWARGRTANLLPSAAGSWVPLSFILADPDQGNEAPYDPTAVLSLGIQFYSGAGNDTLPKPTPAVLYVSHFSSE